MKHSGTEEGRTACAAWAREWSRKISATEKGYFLDRAKRARDDPGKHRPSGLRFDALRIADLYPWPISEALRAASEMRLEKMGVGDERIGATAGYDLIYQMLEEPDALLG